LRYRVNARPEPRLRRTADLLFTGARVAVFVDGCFWHGCPEHHTAAKANAAYWADKVNVNRARDAQTTSLLREAGWTVLRIWEHVPPDEAADLIVRAVSDTKSDPGQRG
jgi:DNA mismatch endonuclease (patch repair protein)